MSSYVRICDESVLNAYYLLQQQWCNMLFSLYVGVTLDELCSLKLSGIPLLHRLP